MTKVIQNQLPTVLKVMKYAIQPVLFDEPLEHFLEVFDNLDFLPYNNLTKFNDMNKYLMESNTNPRVFMCQYAGKPEILSPWNCNLFHASMTNEGIGEFCPQEGACEITVPK